MTTTETGVVGATKRADIEGLRAIAVGLVVAYHAGVEPLSGGFVGVDVFFVLSGFLITKLLLDEVTREGTISLRGFWARRMRRIVPMSLVVVVATVVAGLFMLEPGRTRELGAVALGAIGFCANIVLYATSGEYLAGVMAPSPLQHYWSLAVEEQFYVVWPVLVLLAAKVGRRRWRGVVGVVITLGLAASLATSIMLTPIDPGGGYYLPHSRAWELLVGAGLALLADRVALGSRHVRAVLGWIGLAAIVAASTVFDATTVFPGSAATVPVLGAFAVLMAGGTSWGPEVVLRAKPLQHLGAWSYSLYLWHWPLLLLVETQFGARPWWVTASIVVGAVGLSGLTYHFFENPIRFHSWLVARPWRSLTAGFAAVAVALGGASVVYAVAPRLDATAPTFAAPVVQVVDVAPTTTVPPSPMGTLPPRTDVDVLLLGDSTMAALRWFEDGAVALSGFDWTLDAESCRSLTGPSCEGREERVPTNALDALAAHEGPLDLVILMAGYHGYPSTIAAELRSVADAVRDRGARLVVVSFKESLRFPEPGSKGQRSVFSVFNERLRELVAEEAYAGVGIADWNRFSYSAPEWFRPDGIHLNLEGTVALGWYLSHVVAASTDNPCPFASVHPCPVPEEVDTSVDWLERFGVTATEAHCYEDGKERRRTCGLDRRP